ncbi:unnamed protein product [Phytomonas sp. EM1]|nr:unnamed protein product [Phytomonas sp. EM1]|eukprot:CCW63040.1 unnamed protein product [Phytomonas sp. isolate EM1]
MHSFSASSCVVLPSGSELKNMRMMFTRPISSIKDYSQGIPRMKTLLTYEKLPEPEPECTGSSNSNDFGRKWFAVAGIGAIAAVIGHHFIKNARSFSPQVLWHPGHSYPVDLVCVNMSKEMQALFEHAIALWLDLGKDVQLRFETVTFFEENCTLSLDTVSSATQYATMFAHKQLLCKAAAARAQCGKGDVTALGCVFYQSTIHVNDEAVGLQDCNANILQRLNGGRFHERHAIGFTIDGKGVVIRMHDVEGVLDTARTLRRWGTKGLRDVSLEDALRYCNVPSCTSFEPTTYSPMPSNHGSLYAALVSRITTQDRTVTEPLFHFYYSCFDETSTTSGGVFGDPKASLTTFLWRSPFLLFSEFSALLRYSCLELGGYQRLLKPVIARTTPQSPVPSLITSSPLRFVAKLWGKGREERSAVQKLSVLKYCGAFSIVWLFSALPSTLSSEAVAYLNRYIVSLVEKIAGSSLLSVDVDKIFFYDAGKGAVCDLSVFKTFFTVLNADHVARVLSALMACMGIPLSSVHLIVEVAPSHEFERDGSDDIGRSILWPHPECHGNENGGQYLKNHFYHSNQYFISLPVGGTKLCRMLKCFVTMNLTKKKPDDRFTTKTLPVNAVDLIYVLMELRL